MLIEVKITNLFTPSEKDREEREGRGQRGRDRAGAHFISSPLTDKLHALFKKRAHAGFMGDNLWRIIGAARELGASNSRILPGSAFSSCCYGDRLSFYDYREMTEEHGQ